MVDIRKKFEDVPGLEFRYPEENFINFYTQDGLKLNVYRYPCSQPRRIVFAFHGVHGHSNNYAVVAKYINDADSLVIAIDMRGHGKSEGTAGLFASFDLILGDSLKLIDVVSKMYPSLPIFLFGFSIGGCLSLHISTILKERIKGMILMCPAISAVSRAEGCVRSLLRCFNCCCPSMMLIRGDPRKATSDERAVEYIWADPLIYTEKARVGTVCSTLVGMNRVRTIINSISTPFILFQGSSDQVANPKSAQELYKVAKTKDKLLFMYEGIGHGMVYSKEIYEICEKIRDWISDRV